MRFMTVTITKMFSKCHTTLIKYDIERKNKSEKRIIKKGGEGFNDNQTNKNPQNQEPFWC
ncbi:hypothetical protein BLOT_011209 [Blomia tropicalis]|nr:hypothetical protein BLOT_011209 [Blomia tropicalis]